MKSKTNKIIKVHTENGKLKTRCVICNSVMNKENINSHCKKAHPNMSPSAIHFDDAGMNPNRKLFINYHDYIKSEYWKSKANRMRKLADYRCQVCYSYDDVLEVHHRTYERLGRELDSDLIVLCHSCHTLFEAKSKIKQVEI